MDVKFDFIELEHNARLLVATCRIRPIDPTTLTLIDWDEIRTFRTDKRKDEHLSARWLLEQALSAWGLKDLTALMISRTEERAPYLNVIHGMWIQYSLPSISISHSDGLACVALIDEGWTVGLDAEPLNRPPKPAVFDMMAKGEELERLNEGKIDPLLAWTGKEAIQKALRMGMHFNPREIEIPIGLLDRACRARTNAHVMCPNRSRTEKGGPLHRYLFEPVLFLCLAPIPNPPTQLQKDLAAKHGSPRTATESGARFYP